MNSNMFVSIRTDIGSDFKVKRLCKRFGMEALAWWLLTIIELYCEDGIIYLDDDVNLEIIVEKFSTSTETALRFFSECAEIGLIDGAKWRSKKAVFSESLYKELEYRKTRSEVGKMGGRPKKKTSAKTSS